MLILYILKYISIWKLSLQSVECHTDTVPNLLLSYTKACTFTLLFHVTFVMYVYHLGRFESGEIVAEVGRFLSYLLPAKIAA